ncbi:cryptochrome/photolyase family protein [Haloarcula argentinensis]|uniref:DNA photolyase family protein n=1 Tax=Haloarcula argentinensis TaxID=43776 RepID=A0ABU2EY47_HALAR|nr:deoxyribodipyrimidine photo-lyase [Haloarcula argentinensis]EMA24680.1 photolyase/cryptochrome [Haloarcula argentinensis DSM 12282]MDS0253202.1 DNA photolyase family protein [Haloarcula argentinensis]
MHVFWHQRDLRIPDNRGLTAAAADDEVLPVYVLDTDLLANIGKRQKAFLLAGVRALKQAYRDHGGDLLVRKGSAVEVLSDVVDEYDADRVYYNEHYRPVRRNRQRRVDEALPTKSLTDLVLVDPAGLDSQYENHSRFYDDWQAHHKLPPVGSPDSGSLVDVSDSTTAPSIETELDLPTPGYEGARQRYDDFLTGGIETYNDTRDDMRAAVERPTSAVSRMSPYLAAGMIGIREMWRDASDRHTEATGDAQRNIQKYRYELSWREQSYHLLYHNPTLLSENYKSFPNRIEWENDEDNFEAWKRGETGYPLIDAGMRQLEQEGYIHNRPRQNVASFLTKHLLVDWREGARHFRKRLVDHDPANNAASWQWTASTGTDSVDVRIFDPVAQMSKYDSGADYVTEYVPELRGVPSTKIVDWPTLSDGEREELAPDYYHPIVDRNAAYERAQRVFETALGKR